MGASDPFVFREYESIITKTIGKSFESVAFLGFSGENSFTRTIHSVSSRDFYDRSLGNWEINSDWALDKTYDLIVSTRCPYFSKNPQIFLEKCLQHTRASGHVFLDWGLGDHWRFSNYKVGWVRDGHHEHAYSPDNFLYSCFWHDNLSNDANVQQFWRAVKQCKFGYDSTEDLNDVVKREVPCLINYKTKELKTLFLQSESPQLYIITLISKDDFCSL